MIIVLLSGCGLVALIDHRDKQGMAHVLSDLALIGLSIPAVWLTFIPLTHIFDSVNMMHSELIASLTPKITSQTQNLMQTKPLLP